MLNYGATAPKYRFIHCIPVRDASPTGCRLGEDIILSAEQYIPYRMRCIVLSVVHVVGYRLLERIR